MKLAEIALRAVALLLSLVEKRVSKPAPRKPDHDGVSDAEIDRLLARSKDLN